MCLNHGFSSELLKHIKEGEVVYWCGRKMELNCGQRGQKDASDSLAVSVSVMSEKEKTNSPKVSSWMVVI